MEPNWKGDIPNFPSTGDEYADLMREAYWAKMKELRRLRVAVRGTPVGVSLPRYTLEDFWADPQVIECYLYIEKFKLKQKISNK